MKIFRDKYFIAAMFVFALALALRLVGIKWGLPDMYRSYDTYHPDEAFLLVPSHAMAFKHTLLPHYYDYPSLYMYVGALSLKICSLFGPLTIRTEYLILRLSAALFGAAAVLAVYFAGARISGSKKFALLASFLLAVTPFHVQYSHYASVHVPQTLFSALVLLWAARIMSEPTRRNHVIGGIMVGLAAGTCYNAASSCVAIITAWFLTENRKFKDLFASAAAAVCAFFVVTPGPLFEPMKFAGFMSFQVKHAMYGHSIVFTGYRGYEYNFTAALFYGIGAVLLTLSIIGILMTFVRRDKNIYPAAVFSLIYYLASANSKVLCVRYFLLVYPALAICAAYGIWAVYKALKPKPLRFAWGALCLCGAVWTCFYVCALNNLFCKEPTEKSASDYIYRNIPAGTELAMPYPWSYYPVFSNGFRGEKSDFVTVTPRPVEYTFKYLWSFDYFPKDPEWDEIILARADAPGYAVFSDYDTIDPLRLRNNKRCPAGWRKTVEHRCAELDALKENYVLMKEFKHKLDFAGVEVFDIKNLPHDMKYPDSEISIYRHR